MASNGTQGSALKKVCPDGYLCEPAPCSVENSNRLPGPACACLDGFEGEIVWSGSVADGECRPAACVAENARSVNGLLGLDCACADGFDGEVTWTGPLAQVNCRPAACEAEGTESSNGLLGLDCACADGYEGDVTWTGPHAQVNCLPAACNVANSNSMPGRDCACDAYSEGTISWSGAQATGKCEDIVTNIDSIFAENEDEFSYLGKSFKCCVYSKGGETPIIQDISTKPLPSARSYGEETGCGRMFGDSWHSSKHSKADNKCSVKLSTLVEATGITRQYAIHLLVGR